jgi:hypothetical protein
VTSHGAISEDRYYPTRHQSNKVLIVKRHQSLNGHISPQEPTRKKGHPTDFQTLRFKYKHIFQLVEPLWFSSLKVLLKHRSCTN